MYKIDPMMYGIRLTFTGTIGVTEMTDWVTESIAILQKINTPFSVLVDMRGLHTLNPEARAILTSGQRMYKSYGMSHSAVLLSDKELEKQIASIAQDSSIINTERYYGEDNYNAALDWVIGIQTF